jgi:N-acetylglucosaminyl-diphospho-decaprenol L-rhamnosyltransferase
VSEGTPHPRVSVVIVNWNSRAEALDCLASLARHAPSVPWEAIVVDNGSADGSVAAIEGAAPWARVIVNDRNRGLAAANNQGLRAARGEAVVISNPDVLFDDGTVDELLAALERHPRAAFVVPRLLHPDGTLQTSAGDLPSVSDALLGRQLARRRSRAGGPSGFWWDGWDHREERPIGHGAEACYVVRAAALVDVGLQDERYILDWEGIDWSARAWSAGWEVWFCPSAGATHVGGASVRQVPFRWVLRSHRGMYRYFRSRRPAALRPALWLAFAVRAVAKLAAVGAGLPMHERALRGGARSGH